MNPKDITNKEIQYNIMIALMQIAGHLSDMVEQDTVTDYDVQNEVIIDESSGLS